MTHRLQLQLHVVSLSTQTGTDNPSFIMSEKNPLLLAACFQE